MIDCPACKRTNAPHRATCLYCGAPLPGGGVAPAPKPVLPANLDELIQAALRKGEIGKLKQAIVESQSAAPEAPAEAPPERAEPGLELQVETRVEVVVLRPPEPPPPPTPEQLLRRLVEGATALEGGWHTDASLSDKIDRLEELLVELRAQIPVTPAAAPVVLPPIRQAWSLVLEGPDEPEAAGPLAGALELDLATARMLSVGRGLRVARRAAQRAELEPFLPRLAALDLHASLVSREEIQALSAPRFVLRLGGDRWELADGALWELDPERLLALRGDAVPPGAVRVAVPGEVVSRRYRVGRNSRKDLRPELVGERRVGVVDLYGQGFAVRVVEGASDPSPAAPPGPALPRFRAFLEELPGRFPGVHVEARRVCRPLQDAQLREGAERNESMELSGWPIFEEHSRLCRVHLLRRFGCL